MSEVEGRTYFADYGKNWLHVEGLSTSATYYLSIQNYGGTSADGSFGLCIKDYKDNDFWEMATDLDSFMNSCSEDGSYSTLYASGDGPNLISGYTNAAYSNVWFKFTATTTFVNIIAKREGMRYIRLALFKEDGNGGLTEIVSRNSYDEYAKNWLSYNGLTINKTYYFSVDTNVLSNNQGGTFSICLKNTKDNDFWESALDINAIINNCTAIDEYSTLIATGDGPQASAYTNAPYSNLWFKFEATETKFMNIVTTRGGIRHMKIALFEKVGASLSELSSKNSIDDYGKNWLQLDNLVEGRTYYLSVDNTAFSASQGGTFGICLKDHKDFDLQSDPVIVDLSLGSYNGTFSTESLSGDGPQPSSWSSLLYSNGWFKFSVDFEGTLNVNIERGGIQYLRAAIFDQSNQAQAVASIQADRFDDVVFSNLSLPIGTYNLSVGNRPVSHTIGGTFDLTIDYDIDLQCVDVLWAISSGDWESPYTWSETEGGPPAPAIPCDQTDVHIKGFDVTFNAASPVTAKSIELQGTSNQVTTRLNVESGELNVIDQITTSGPGVILRSSTQGVVKVTGTDE